MGYYTQHNLSVLSGNSHLIQELREQSQGARTAINNNGDCLEPCKWYNHDKDLRDFSKNHPNEVFKLDGVGEEHPDIWREHYKNGLKQREKAIITFPAFNENQLI